MSTFVMHHTQQLYGVRERTEDLLVWQSADASASSAAYLVAFLNAHCRNVPAHDVRRALCALGNDLSPIDTPPSAVEGRRDTEPTGAPRSR
jgi:hypothetical protein